MRVERRLRGGERREAVNIVERIEQSNVQDRLYAAPLHLIAHAVAGRRIDIGRGPAIASGDDAHAIGPQAIGFAQQPVDEGAFDIGVAIEQKIGARAPR